MNKVLIVPIDFTKSLASVPKDETNDQSQPVDLSKPKLAQTADQLFL